ncbi:arylsulfatase AslA [Maricurvus nonylphenolicus]|uniref:sulfatase-like hydrolase/transferase n=1 Tax=Maricurvus nonylphenolicus TaxID=1008307 RepID=UPI0036F31F1F
MKFQPLWAFAACLLSLSACARDASQQAIVHDAEHYVLLSQNGEQWQKEDKTIDAKLAELRKKYGKAPNIVHVLWDDTSYGDVGIPAINIIRGFSTPNINRMAAEGAMYSRMYSEPSCTPTRAAAMTGRHPVRNGMYGVGFPIEYKGLSGQEKTIAEVLSEAGYATAFYGKWHLGDIEESYPHNQGFDEALFTPYNQVLSLWNKMGEGVNAVQGLIKPMLVKDPYAKDKGFTASGWVMTLEGKKGQQAQEWGDTSHNTYVKIDPESQKRTLDFIRRNADGDKPFYVAYWPNMTSFIPNPKKRTLSRSLFGESMQYNVDAFIGRLMEELKTLKIAENTLVIAMADNGPMSHNPPPGLGMTETIFRGGKGDFTEGGVRVPAFAWWPGVVEPQLVGDIFHVTDLYTTFARLGQATTHIPRDRVIDGVDQTSLILNGDTHSRRDYVHIYTGPVLGATVKGHWKFHWVNDDPTSKSGIGAAMYNLLNDTREHNPVLVNGVPHLEGFKRMRKRHLMTRKQYPDAPAGEGDAYTGIENARPETLAASKRDNYIPTPSRVAGSE